MDGTVYTSNVWKNNNGADAAQTYGKMSTFNGEILGTLMLRGANWQITFIIDSITFVPGSAGEIAIVTGHGEFFRGLGHEHASGYIQLTDGVGTYDLLSYTIKNQAGAVLVSADKLMRSRGTLAITPLANLSA